MFRMQLLHAFLLAAIFTESGIANASSSAQLSWSIPSTRENGQALAVSELAGYEIYYTTDDPSVSGAINVSGGSTSAYKIQNLAAGNYHFAMSSIDTKGVKSKLSSVVDIKLADTSSTATVAPNTPAPVTGSTSSSTIASLRTITLNWTVPNKRTNGTSLSATDLYGYEIQFKNATDTGFMTVKLQGGSLTNHAFKNMKTGQYAFTVAAIDKAGVKSQVANLSFRAL